MNIKEYKNCKDSTKTVDYKDFDKTGNNVYSLISLLSKRSETIFCYIKSKLKKKIKLCPEPKHLEEVVLSEAKMKISKIFEKISKPTSLAIREFLDKKLYYIFKKQLKKTIKQIIKNKLIIQFKNQDPFGNQLEKEEENKKNFNNNKKFQIKLENKLKKKLEKKF
ncbi:MAG: hypothetical protein ACKA35_00930 [Candidatus Karelsulcia muelleri]